MGGLLSAYHLSDEDPIFLEKAKELADRMIPIFDTPSGLPSSMVNLEKREAVDDPHVPGLVSTAEATTIQLELKYLSYLTDDDTYWDKAEQVSLYESFSVVKVYRQTGYEIDQIHWPTLRTGPNIPKVDF